MILTMTKYLDNLLEGNVLYLLFIAKKFFILSRLEHLFTLFNETVFIIHGSASDVSKGASTSRCRKEVSVSKHANSKEYVSLDFETFRNVKHTATGREKENISGTGNS